MIIIYLHALLNNIYNCARNEVKTLKGHLKLEKERVDTFQGISQASEERLAELNRTYDLYKKETEDELEKARTEADALRKENDEIRERLNSTVQEITSTQENMDHQKAEFERTVKEFETRLHGAKASEENVSLMLSPISLKLTEFRHFNNTTK